MAKKKVKKTAVPKRKAGRKKKVPKKTTQRGGKGRKFPKAAKLGPGRKTSKRKEREEPKKPKYGEGD